MLPCCTETTHYALFNLSIVALGAYTVTFALCA